MPLPRKICNLFTLVLDMSAYSFTKHVLDILLTFTEYPIIRDDCRKNLIMIVLMNCDCKDQIKVLIPKPIVMQGELLMEAFKEKQPKEINYPVDWIRAVDIAVELIENVQMRKDIRTYYLIVISPLKVPSFSDWGPCARKMKLMNIQFIACIDQNISYSCCYQVRHHLSLRTAHECAKIPQITDSINIALKIANYAIGVVTEPKHFLDFVTYMEKKPSPRTWTMRLYLGQYKYPTLISQAFYPQENIIKCDKKAFVCYGQRQSPINYSCVHHDINGFVRPNIFANNDMASPDSFNINFLMPSKEQLPSCTIYRFVKKIDLPDIYFGGNETYAITTDLRSKRAGHFVELLERLFIKDLYAIVRMKVSASLYVLVPKAGGWALLSPLIQSTGSWRRRNLIHSRKTFNFSIISSNGMHKLRWYLLNGNKTLFYPQFALGMDANIVIDDVRRNFGFNKEEGYNVAVPLKVEVNNELEAILKQEFCNDSYVMI